MRPADEGVVLRLRQAGRLIDYPQTPDVRVAVTSRIASTPSVGAKRPVQIAVAAAFVILVIVALVLPASPKLRRAAADALGVIGIDISFVDELPRAEAALELGERVSLARARAAVAFEMEVPSALGLPDEVYFDRFTADGMVSFVYKRRPGLPETVQPGVGALFTQFEGSVDTVFARKLVPQETNVRVVAVGGAAGYLLSGGAHGFLYVDDSGRSREERLRLADDVLLWDRGGITYRLEAALPPARMVDIARSLSP